MRTDDDVRWGGGGKDDVRMRSKNGLFRMTSFMYSPLWDQMNQVGRGLHEKIVPIGRGVCMRLLGEGELCKFKFKVGGALE